MMPTLIGIFYRPVDARKCVSKLREELKVKNEIYLIGDVSTIPQGMASSNGDTTVENISPDLFAGYPNTMYLDYASTFLHTGIYNLYGVIPGEEAMRIREQIKEDEKQLKNINIPTEYIESYKDKLDKGATMIVVKDVSRSYDKLTKFLKEHGAEEVRIY